MTATAVREHPMLFMGPMVRAIIDGRKTVTRRPVDLSEEALRRHRCASDCAGPEPERAWADPGLGDCGYLKIPCKDGAAQRYYPRWFVDDRLWVKETWRGWNAHAYSNGRHSLDVEYRADGQRRNFFATSKQRAQAKVGGPDIGDPWRPSIFMPRWACRLVLEVTDVRVERLQDITRAEVAAEGLGGMAAVDDFHAGWDRLYRAKPKLQWDANPWLWRIAFRRVEQP